MLIHIELRPEEEKALLERARMAGRDPAQYVLDLVRAHTQAAPSVDSFDGLIDHEFLEYCEREADDSVTLEDVRATTSKGEERADRSR